MTMTNEQMAAADDIGKQAIMEAQAALIDAQAATIARLTALMMDVDGISDAIGESFDVDWSSRDGAHHVVGYFETEIARAALTCAASE